MKKLIVLVGVVSLLSACSPGYVATQPTYMDRARPARPGENYIWRDGGWVWSRQTHAYRQRDGDWVMTNRGRTYRQGYWKTNKRGSYWVPGRWN